MKSGANRGQAQILGDMPLPLRRNATAVDNVDAENYTPVCLFYHVPSVHNALKTLKAHGLQGRALWALTQATLVAQITYAGPSWRGFIKAEETARLKAVMLKARHYGYLPTDFFSLDDLLDSSDESLFRSISYNPQHVLH